MTLLFFNNTKITRIVQQQQQKQQQPFRLVKASSRICASLKIQGNKKCGSCGGK